MTRKVKLTRSDVELAKHFNVPLEEVAKAKLPKRGRPVGSKNKPKIIKMLDVQVKEGKKKVKAYSPTSFEDALKEWDRIENETDWETIAKKQEDRIKAYIAENDELARICVMRWDEIQHLKYLVSYLEGRNEDHSV